MNCQFNFQGAVQFSSELAVPSCLLPQRGDAQSARSSPQPCGPQEPSLAALAGNVSIVRSKLLPGKRARCGELTEQRLATRFRYDGLPDHPMLISACRIGGGEWLVRRQEFRQWAVLISHVLKFGGVKTLRLANQFV
jgi:hypothetical protein